MPHKRNPVLTENLTGLARLVRSSVVPALENVTLWHERDISHSSVERMIAPDATITLDFAIHRLTNVIENLLIYPNTMRLNLEKLGGLVHSQQVLLALTQKGASRESAYEMVQSNAMKVWETPEYERKNVYKKLLIDDQNVRKFLDEAEIEKLFNLATFCSRRYNFSKSFFEIGIIQWRIKKFYMMEKLKQYLKALLRIQ